MYYIEHGGIQVSQTDKLIDAIVFVIIQDTYSDTFIIRTDNKIIYSYDDPIKKEQCMAVYNAWSALRNEQNKDRAYSFDREIELQKIFDNLKKSLE